MVSTYNIKLQTMSCTMPNFSIDYIKDYQNKIFENIFNFSPYNIHVPIVGDNQEPIILNKVIYNHNVLNLKQELYLNIFHEDNLFVVENNSLNIRSYGKTMNEALNSFQEDFLSLWEEIGLEKKELLSPKACELKDKLSEIVFQSN
ncbi:MAG: hypothetical protein A2Y41_03930 [Spirochaetes bacterium GWB1_36_13]|nr:MAG: hypothetical protein A2Y41_03930 [Spirochaetes bacterium GWB1_36_13]